MGKPTKETTVAEADKKAAAVKSEADLKAGIISEALALAKGEQHSVQQLLAYARQLLPKDKK